MNNGKKVLQKMMFFLLSIVLCFISLNAGVMTSEAYVVVGDENNRLPVTPDEALDSKVDFRDAFVFPGNFGGTATDYQANHAYLSNSRANVVMLYDGTIQNQKSMVWYGTKLNLNKPFEFEYYVFLSNQENVDINGMGDGIAFVMQNDPASTTAIGGRGGGIGVYPIDNTASTVNMIYNSLALEFDTYDNDATHRPNYDAELAGITSVTWPHIALGTTATTTQRNYGNAAVREVYNNFTHRAVTLPQNRTEANTWFGDWKKVSVKWTPQADGVNALYTYQFEDYPAQSQLIDIDETFQSVWGTGARPTWDRKVTWGFTGSNYLTGNAFGVMITKLPQEPELTVERQVRNVTKGETTYRTNTVADADDILEYKVNVLNKVVEDSEISLKKTKVVEALKTNQYVPGSLSFSNSIASSGASLPTVTIDSDNNFTYVDENYEYAQGDSFEYKYLVTVGTDTKEFINDVKISSTYSTAQNYGETTVNVMPRNLQMDKKVDGAVSTNPIVDEEVTVTLEVSVEDGRFLMNKVTDSVPSGFEVIPNSTYIYNKGATGPNQLLSDSTVWSGSNLTVDRSANPWSVSGGQTETNTLVIEYKIKPTEAMKGKTVTLGKAATEGTNKYVSTADKHEYQAESNVATIQVKTDVVLSFKDLDDNLLAANKIISTNTDFNGKNPVTLYYNTGDSFDLTSIINEISGHIFTNDQLTKVSVDGDIVETDLAEVGSIITIFYSAKTTLTINFVNEVGAQLNAPITQEHNIGDFVDLTTDQDVIDVIEAIELRQYVMAERPTDEDNLEIIVGGTEVTYKFKGTLILSSAPDKIDFGLHNTGSYGAFTADKPTYDNPLVVSDSRATLTRWTLTATVTEVMTSAEDPSYKLPEALVYKSDSGEDILELNQARVITTHQHASNGSYNVSEEEWENKDNGFEMKISSTQYRKMSEYKATILFTVSETP